MEGFSLLNYGTVENGKFIPSVPTPFTYETEGGFDRVTIGEVIDGTPYVVSRFEDVWRVGWVGKVRVIECCVA